MTSIFNIGDVLESIGEIIYDEAILAEIKTVLQASAEDLESGKDLPDPTQVSYGGSDASARLAANAALARQTVVDAITDMAIGLQGYRTVVDDFHAKTEEVTASSVADTRQIELATDCVGGSDYRTPTQCELPSTTGGDN